MPKYALSLLADSKGRLLNHVAVVGTPMHSQNIKHGLLCIIDSIYFLPSPKKENKNFLKTKVVRSLHIAGNQEEACDLLVLSLS